MDSSSPQRWGLVWGRAPQPVRYSVAYDPEEMKLTLGEMCHEAGVEDAEAAVEGGAGCFHTVGEGKVLFPWGATEKLRRIDPTSPEDLSFALLECRRRVMERALRWSQKIGQVAKVYSTG